VEHRQARGFGSLLREDFGNESDVDFLVTFEPGKGPAGMSWFQVKEELAELVGRKVDVLDRRLVEQSRNLYRRHHILREATAVYGGIVVHDEIAAWAAAHAGTGLDLDGDLENAGLEVLASGFRAER
jgi:uncharacterized protein